MGLLPIVLKLDDTPFYNFASHSVRPYRGVELFVTTDSHPTQMILLTNFFIVDTFGVYNAIIELSTLNALRVVSSTYHLALKFPTSIEVGVVYGN